MAFTFHPERTNSVVAEASLWVDGTKIYSIPHLGMRLIDETSTAASALLVPCKMSSGFSVF